MFSHQRFSSFFRLIFLGLLPLLMVSTLNILIYIAVVRSRTQEVINGKCKDDGLRRNISRTQNCSVKCFQEERRGNVWEESKFERTVSIATNGSSGTVTYRTVSLDASLQERVGVIIQMCLVYHINLFLF